MSSMYFRYFVIISLLKKAWPFIWTNLNSLYHMMLCDKFGWYWHCGSGDWRFLYFVNAFSLIRNYLPLEMGLALHLIKFESTLPKDVLCQVWLKMAKWFWRRTILNFVNVFWLLRNYLPLEKGGALYWNKLESPSHKGCFVPSLVEIGSVVLEKKIFKFHPCIFTISLVSPLGEGWGPSFEQTWIPFTQGYFVPSLVKIGPVVLEKKIFKSCQFIFINSQLSPLWEGMAFHLNKLESPLTKETLCQVWLK